MYNKFAFFNLLQMIIEIISAIIIVVLLGAVAYFYFVYSPLPRQPQLSGKIHQGKINISKHDRSYLAYIPEKLSAQPGLIIAMHGTGMDAVRMRQWTGYELDSLADQHGFMVIYPDGYKGNWNDCRTNSPFEAKKENIDDVGFVQSLINKYEQEQHIDPAKVFVFGFSNGGQMAMRLAMERPRLIGAICAISANLPTPETCSCVSEGLTSKIMLVTGTEDSINPYTGGAVSLFGLKKVGTAISAKATAEHFVQRNGIIAEPEILSLPRQKASDPTSVQRERWRLSGKAVVELYTINGGGHVIPQPKFRFPRLMGKTTGNFNAPLEAAKFFGLT
jgi:polyhydroxybutyrate depolymerase